jgi:hypothetical protein
MLTAEAKGGPEQFWTAPSMAEADDEFARALGAPGDIVNATGSPCRIVRLLATREIT